MKDRTLEKEERGSLNSFPLVAILLSAQKSQSSGQLIIEGMGSKRTLFFEQGKFVYVHSEFKDDHLLNILLAQEKLNKRQVATIIQRAKEEKKQLAELFLEMKFIQKPEEMSRFTLLAAQERFKRCFAAIDGNFHYQEGTLPAQGIPRLNLNLEQALFAGVRSYYPAEMFSQELPKLIPDNTIRLKEGRYEQLEEMVLQPEEKGVISIINDYPLIKELAEASYLEEKEVYAILFVFCLLDILEIETPGDRQDRELTESFDKDGRARKVIIENFYNSLFQKNYFDIFAVKPMAENNQVERAYKKLCKEYAKDEIEKYFSGSKRNLPEELHSKLLEIKEILIDIEKRREYIVYLKSGKRGDFSSQSQILNADKKYRSGLAEFQKKNFPKALELLREASTINPRDAKILADLGWAYLVLSAKDPSFKDEGLSCLQRSIASDPQEYRPYLYWASLSKREGKTEEAKAFFRETLLRNPASDKAYAEIAAGSKALADKIVLEGMFEGLDRWNYYEILRQPRNASLEQIKKAYYRLSKKFHPDRYFNTDSSDEKEMAKAIYKRLVEAYMVLRNTYKRREYDHELISSQSGGAVRLQDAADVVQRKDGREETIHNAQARKFYELALTAMSQHNINAAKMNLNLALAADPENEFLQDKLEEILAGEKSSAVESQPQQEQKGG